MASTPGLVSPLEPASDRDEGGRRAAERPVVALGTWIAILGTIRLACEITEYAALCRQAMASGPIASRGWGWFLHAHPPILALVGAWPLLLGLAIRHTGWRDLARAAALTFLVLSVGGLLTMVADWSQGSSRWIAIGSFRLPRTAWSRLPPVGRAMGIAGAAQLFLEMATAAWALFVAFRGDGDDPRAADPRRPRFGRLALYFSVAFLLLTVRLPAWSAYLELISQSRWVRELILRDDLARLRSTRRPALPESEWAAQARTLFEEGAQAWRDRDYAESSDHYAHLAALINTIPPPAMTGTERKLAAEALNNWAWLLATCPEKNLQNHADAVKYARRALGLEPDDYYIWNTLGVAYFRLGAWDDALNALYRSMELHDEGDSSDWLFLAMIHQRLGHKERAREWYEKAIQSPHRLDPDDEEMYRFEVEAAETLGLPRPERPPPAAGRRLGPRPPGPPPSSERRGRMGPRFGGSERSSGPARSFGRPAPRGASPL